MNIKIERIIGVTLFLIGIALGVIINLFTSDNYIQAWYNKNRTLIICIMSGLILLGIILSFFSLGSSREISYWKKLLKKHRAKLSTQRERQRTLNTVTERLVLLDQIENSEKDIRKAKDKLRKLDVEPEPSTIDPHENFETYPDHIIKTYPVPIAQACSNFNEEQEIGRKFAALDRLITHLVKYLSAIFIGQARHDRPPEFQIPQKLKWISNPTMESWAEAIGDLSKIYSKSPWKEKFISSDLLSACTRSLLPNENLVNAVDYLTMYLDKPGIDNPSMIDFLQLLSRYREREWQEDTTRYPIYKIKPLMLRLQPAMALLLKELKLLEHYPLVYVERVNTVESGIQLRIVKFMGQFTEDVPPPNKPALTLPKKEAHHIKRHHFYLGDTNTGECIPQLNLHPFFILYRWELFVLERHAPSNFIEFHSCSGGNRLRPPDGAPTFYASWWEDQTHEQPGEEFPPLFGETEDWTDSLEDIPPDNSLESIPLTWLSPQGRRALEIALGEALRLGRSWLGIEFLLMGLTKQKGCAMSELFHQIGISRRQFRGMIRGILGNVSKDDWRSKDVFELGAQVFPDTRPANPHTLAANYLAGKEQPTVITPRMMEVLKYASKLADEKQIDHVHLLLAALNHNHTPAVKLLLAIAAEAGWKPDKVKNRVMQLVGLPGEPQYQPPPQNSGQQLDHGRAN